MRARFLLLASVLLGPIAQTSDAAAESFHERVEAKPIILGGETVGLRLKLTLRPDGSQKVVRVGLGAKFNSASGIAYADQAMDPRHGYLHHQFPEQIQIEGTTPKEVTLEVLYKDAPKLNPGGRVEVVSAWVGTGRIHVWGMTRSVLAGTEITLPAPKTVGSPSSATSASARARLSHRTAARQAARRATARQTARRAAVRARR